MKRIPIANLARTIIQRVNVRIAASIISIFIMLLFQTKHVMAQPVKGIGVYHELNMVMSGKNNTHTDTIITGGLGVYAVFPFSNKFTISPSIGYLRKGLNIETELLSLNGTAIGRDDVKYRQDFISIALGFQYYVSDVIYFELAPNFNLGIASAVYNNDAKLFSPAMPAATLNNEAENPMEIGTSLKIGCQIKQKLHAALAYNYAFNEIYSDNATSIRLDMIQLRLGYLLFPGKKDE